MEALKQNVLVELKSLLSNKIPGKLTASGRCERNPRYPIAVSSNSLDYIVQDSIDYIVLGSSYNICTGVLCTQYLQYIGVVCMSHVHKEYFVYLLASALICFIFTLYPAYSGIGRGNLAHRSPLSSQFSRHSVLSDGTLSALLKR